MLPLASNLGSLYEAMSERTLQFGGKKIVNQVGIQGKVKLIVKSSVLHFAVLINYYNIGVSFFTVICHKIGYQHTILWFYGCEKP
jgi:hypothetical protein